MAKDCAHNPADIERQFFKTSADVPDPRELSSDNPLGKEYWKNILFILESNIGK